MKKSILLLLTFCAVITALVNPAATFAQTVDDTGELDESITGTALLYAAVRVNDLNENGATDVVLTLSENEIAGWADYSTAVRFTADQIDVRNGEEFSAPANVIPVDFNSLFHIWMAVDVPAKTYTVWAKTNTMSNPVLIYEDAAFRNDAVTSLTRWSALHNPDAEADQLTVDVVEEVPENYAISLPGGADGNLSHVAIPALNLTSLPVTVEMWFKPDPAQNNYSTLWYNRGESNNAGFQYDRWNDQTKVKAVWNGASELPGHAPEPDEWNHMALVITETDKTFYVNGEPTTEPGDAFAIYEFDGVTYLGWDEAVADRTLNGLIDELRIWSTARTAQELEDNKSATLNGDETGLVGYWNFDDRAESATDLTANGNHGTISGGEYTPSFAATDIAQSPDATLSALEVDAGVLQPDFHPEVGSYEVHFPEGVTSITVTATPNDAGASMTGDGAVDVSSGSATATITVTAEDGVTEMTYTIEFRRTSNYAMKLPGANGENSHVALPAIDLTTLPVTIELLMKPEGAQPDYAGLFFNTEANAGGLLFVGWQQNGGVGGEMGGQANPEDEFSIRTFSSEDANLDEWNHVAVVLTETSRTLYLNGTPYIEEFAATAPDFNQGTTYIGWHDSETGRAFKGLIDEVRIWNTARTFEDVQNNKFATLEGDETGLIGYWNFDDMATVVTDLTGNGYDGTITGGQYAPSFDASDATLSEITLDVGELNEEFNPDVADYTVTVPASTQTVTVSATTTESFATITGIGEVDVSSGIGTATIVVTALDGETTKTYTVQIVHEALPEGATLAGLTADIGELDPEFHAGITSYLLVLPAGTSAVSLTATPEDEAADVTGDGELDVSSGSAVAEIVVTSGDGERTMTYTVEIYVGSPYGPLELNHSYTFEDGTANDVVGEAHGTIEGGLVSYGSFVASEEGHVVALPAEEIAINTYRAVTFEAYVTAGNDVNGGMTMLAYFGGSPGNVGANGWFMTIARSDDKSRTAISCGNESSPWTVEEGADGPKLEDGKRHHLVSVLTDDSIVWYIDGVRQNAALLSEHNKIANLSNEFGWLCRGGYASDPTWRGSIHEFNIYSGVMGASEIADRSDMYIGQSDATLVDITLDAGKLDRDFDPLLTSYSVLVPAGITTVNVTATPNYSEATVVGDGAIDVSSGSATATIVVNAKDGVNTKTYTLNFTVTELGSDATLSDLTADVGQLQPEFDPETTAYTLKVPEGTTVVNLAATPGDDAAEVTGDGEIDLSSGSATAEILVTAEDGETTRTYTVEITEDVTTGITDRAAMLFNIYPTVSNGDFTVRFTGSPGSITVTDMYGKVVLRKTAASAEETIRIPATGVFIIGLESGGITGRYRVIKIN